MVRNISFFPLHLPFLKISFSCLVLLCLILLRVVRYRVFDSTACLVSRGWAAYSTAGTRLDKFFLLSCVAQRNRHRNSDSRNFPNPFDPRDATRTGVVYAFENRRMPK